MLYKNYCVNVNLLLIDFKCSVLYDASIKCKFVDINIIG